MKPTNKPRKQNKGIHVLKYLAALQVIFIGSESGLALVFIGLMLFISIVGTSVTLTLTAILTLQCHDIVHVMEGRREKGPHREVCHDGCHHHKAARMVVISDTTERSDMFESASYWV